MVSDELEDLKEPTYRFSVDEHADKVVEHIHQNDREFGSLSPKMAANIAVERVGFSHTWFASPHIRPNEYGRFIGWGEADVSDYRNPEVAYRHDDYLDVLRNMARLQYTADVIEAALDQLESGDTAATGDDE